MDIPQQYQQIFKGFLARRILIFQIERDGETQKEGKRLKRKNTLIQMMVEQGQELSYKEIVSREKEK